MRKLGLTFYCIILTLICQPTFAVFAEDASPNPENPNSPETTVLTPTEAQKTAILANCTALKDQLRKLQKDDSHARVYLGGRYEKLINQFITPLNVRLVENNLSSAELIETQNSLVKSKATFVADFVDYQRELESLVNIDCTVDPTAFFTTLQTVRQKRTTVASDNTKVRSLLESHRILVTNLKDRL